MTTTFWLYEHEDGRHIAAPAGAAILAGDPHWHRVGPVDVQGVVNEVPLDACRAFIEWDDRESDQAGNFYERMAMSDWVKTTDKMPEVDTDCLVYSKQPWEQVPSIKLDVWCEQHEAPLSFSSATVPIGLGWNDHDDFESVTHWMPLPAQPKA